MKQTLLLITLTLSLLSCTRPTEYTATLSQVESYIEARPDSALTVLQDINPSALTKADKAKHALLLSMAYDENDFNKVAFESLQPALDYYGNNGTATDKLLTYYYEGVIYLNMGDEAAAMESFLMAIDKGAKSDDELTKARVYVAQGVIYNSLYDWAKQCEVTLKAADMIRDIMSTFAIQKELFEVMQNAEDQNTLYIANS